MRSLTAAVLIFVDTHILSLAIGIAAAFSALLLGPAGVDEEAGVISGYAHGAS